MGRDFVMQRRVQFAETDVGGVMHFSNYFRLMEECEHAFWRSLGLTVHQVRGGAVEFSWPRVAVSCEYFAPARFEDVLELRLRIVKVSKSSVEHEIEFRRDGQRLALGRMTAVCCAVDGGAFRPIAIPEWVLEKLRSHKRELRSEGV